MSIQYGVPCKKKISVCLATYNGAKYLQQQVDSVLAQLSSEDELVVSDDGSTDSAMQLLASYGDRLRIVNVVRAGGVVKNFERVLNSAKGDGIVLCDQDDVWLPGRLDILRDKLQQYTLVVLNGQVVGPNLEPHGKTVFELVGMKKGFWPNLAKNTFIGCCMGFRRELLIRVLPFPAGVPWHDWYIGLVAECTGLVERSVAITMLYRRHDENFSPTGEKSNNSFGRKLIIRIAILRAVVIAVFLRKS